jgi:hypothetical protein
MRFMMIIKSPASSYDGPPDPAQMKAMSRYNEELERAGVLLEVDGLASTSEGAKVRFAGAKRTIVDGPFTESKEVIGGFWILQVRSREEALEWAKRIPLGTEVHPAYEVEVEVRRIVERSEL